MAEQFHFDPETYLAEIHEDIPGYEEFEDTVAAAAAERPADAVLDLGTGTGETLRRVAAGRPEARLVGVDESPGMLDLARPQLPGAELRVARLQDPLPDGPFALVVSALAVHHLDGAEKADLFRRVAACLAPGGRFVLGDVVVPADPADAVIPLSPGYDKPSTIAEQLQWLRDAGLRAELRWSRHDLAVFVADRD